MTTAVVLFNLGGPDDLKAVRPFLQNLFSDPAIIGAPSFIRLPLAWWIAKKRTPEAIHIYQQMGGKSPLVEETEAQRAALEAALSAYGDFRVVVAMRYWHPRAAQAVAQVKTMGAERVILLPLYPQYSTTTTASSVAEWEREAQSAGLNLPTRVICCYPKARGVVEGHAAHIREQLGHAGDVSSVRLLFSAHGLPEKIVAAGDPYQWQIEHTAGAVVDALGIEGLDWAVCYQSRVGPLKWIGPSTEAEIERAGKDGKAIVICPIAFVSEHSETLVEIEIQYRELAAAKGAPTFFRVPALGVQPDFIETLATLCRDSLTQPEGLCTTRICPADRVECPHYLGETHGLAC